jgi:hypothetical protein
MYTITHSLTSLLTHTPHFYQNIFFQYTHKSPSTKLTHICRLSLTHSLTHVPANTHTHTHTHTLLSKHLFAIHTQKSISPHVFFTNPLVFITNTYISFRHTHTHVHFIITHTLVFSQTPTYFITHMQHYTTHTSTS